MPQSSAHYKGAKGPQQPLHNAPNRSPYTQPPPPYAMQDPSSHPLPPTHTQYPMPPTHAQYPMPPTHAQYPMPPTHAQYPMAPQQPMPAPHHSVTVIQAPPPVIQQSSPSVVVVGNGRLAPGMCTACERGRIENSASCLTWLFCILMLPFGILPGLFIFCCCCRQPKCSKCGYTP